MSTAAPASYRTPTVLAPIRAGEGFARSSDIATLDRADLRVIGLCFGFAVGLVLAAALACDAYLVALLRSAPVSNDAFAGRQLAIDLLPWTVAFTVVALVGLGPIPWICRRLDRASRA